MRSHSRQLATLGLVCVTWFVATVLVLPVIQQPGYDIVSQAISETALGRLGWLQTLAFCVLGMGTIGLAGALGAGVHRAIVGPALLVAAGILDFVSAAFQTVPHAAPMTTTATIHQFAGMLTFLSTIIAMFAFARGFGRTPAWRFFSGPTLAWAIIAAVGFVALGPTNFPEQFGITQRVMAATFISWMWATAWLARSVGTAEPVTGEAEASSPSGASDARA
jgi:uncharacterized protein DUF998